MWKYDNCFVQAVECSTYFALHFEGWLIVSCIKIKFTVSLHVKGKSEIFCNVVKYIL